MDLCLIKNQIPRKLFTKCHSFIKIQSLNYSRSTEEIDRAIKEFAESFPLKYKLEDTAMDL